VSSPDDQGVWRILRASPQLPATSRALTEKVTQRSGSSYALVEVVKLLSVCQLPEPMR
jgi:hypothetical protein